METDGGPDSTEVMEIFDRVGEQLACRVCGALVAGEGGYARTHWDWHSATNGA
jgi:ribosomal protein S27E